MSRNPRINPYDGDVLAIGISQWEVLYADEYVVSVIRIGAVNSMHIGNFREFFRKASTVRYGDEGK